MVELLNFDFQTAMPTMDLDYYRQQITPNLPWADDHFKERVGGWFNPGETWKAWPWALKADESRKHGNGEFSHTYGTRYWPKENRSGLKRDDPHVEGWREMKGHYFPYGDLDDVVDLLVREPQTRQAYLPVWFPEDTGAVEGQRVPCTLGYHWIMRRGFLHLYYPIRSCDFMRHFRDDLYLTVRLTLWLLDQLRERDSTTWARVQPGLFSMWIGSFHVFVNDYRKLYGKSPPER